MSHNEEPQMHMKLAYVIYSSLIMTARKQPYVRSCALDDGRMVVVVTYQEGDEHVGYANMYTEDAVIGAAQLRDGLSKASAREGADTVVTSSLEEFNQLFPMMEETHPLSGILDEMLTQADKIWGLGHGSYEGLTIDDAFDVVTEQRESIKGKIMDNEVGESGYEPGERTWMVITAMNHLCETTESMAMRLALHELGDVMVGMMWMTKDGLDRLMVCRVEFGETFEEHVLHVFAALAGDQESCEVDMDAFADMSSDLVVSLTQRDAKMYQLGPLVKPYMQIHDEATN